MSNLPPLLLRRLLLSPSRTPRSNSCRFSLSGVGSHRIRVAFLVIPPPPLFPGTSSSSSFLSLSRARYVLNLTKYFFLYANEHGF